MYKMTDKEATDLWMGDGVGWKVVWIGCVGNHSRWSVTERTVYQNEQGDTYYIDWPKSCGGDGLEPSDYGPADHGTCSLKEVKTYVPDGE